MFINFWYPAEESKNLTSEPIKVHMLGMPLVLWRDESGKAQCVANTCTHRGGSLGDGKVVGNCIECPYHGWLFNGDGQCERIPSLGPLNKIPERSKIDAYPVEERYGLVFVFLGDLPENERPTIMPADEYEQDGWRAIHMRYVWNCHYERLVENQSDPSHVEYVHSGFGMGGKDDDYKVPKIDIEETEWGAGAMTTFVSPQQPDENLRDLRPREGDAVAGSGYHGAASTWTNVNFNETDRFFIYLYTVPRSETELEIFLINLRNMKLEPEWDERFIARMNVAIEEDRIVVEKLDPVIPSDEQDGEFIVPADDIIMRYREQRREWQANGWRIDTGKMAELKGRKTWAIPCPERRNNPDNWAISPLPLAKP